MSVYRRKIIKEFKSFIHHYKSQQEITEVSSK